MHPLYTLWYERCTLPYTRGLGNLCPLYTRGLGSLCPLYTGGRRVCPLCTPVVGRVCPLCTLVGIYTLVYILPCTTLGIPHPTIVCPVPGMGATSAYVARRGSPGLTFGNN